ncbi:MAG TPA: hypothetical protein VE173_02820, partial [Longimicrobiales bacterium]|nr:hypothetical protein [Longimicrobiales bacterium]
MSVATARAASVGTAARPALLGALLVAAALGPAPARAQEETITIRASRVIDGRGQVLEDARVVCGAPASSP